MGEMASRYMGMMYKMAASPLLMGMSIRMEGACLIREEMIMINPTIRGTSRSFHAKGCREK